MSTLTARRGQGRPGSDEQEVGRDRLLEKVRTAMRLRPRVDIQRREIADVAGVTPALVNYYFPDKWALLESAARPVVEAHIEQVRELLRSTETPAGKLKRLVRQYIVFNREHGHLLDYYMESIQKRGALERLDALATAHGEIVDFLRLNVDEAQLGGTSPEILQSIIWSTCRHVAQLPDGRQAVLFPSEREDEVVDQQSEVICNLLLNGMLHGPRAVQPA